MGTCCSLNESPNLTPGTEMKKQHNVAENGVQNQIAKTKVVDTTTAAPLKQVLQQPMDNQVTISDIEITEVEGKSDVFELNETEKVNVESRQRIKGTQLQHPALVEKSDGISWMLFTTLRSNPFFRSYSDKVLTTMVKFMSKKELKANERVHDIGDETTECYIVESGSLEASKFEDGVLKSRTLEEGNSFGVAGLLSGMCKVTAKERVVSTCRTTVWVLSKAQFLVAAVEENKEKEAERISFLKSVPILADLTTEQLQALARALKRVKFVNGQKIITQGQIGSTFFFIESGKVVCNQRTKKGGKEYINQVSSYSEGDYFGEGSLVQDAPRSADVVAIGEVTCLTLRRNDFDDILGGLQQLLDRNFTARVLRGVDLLANLTNAERTTIADLLVQEEYNEGECIIKQGDNGETFYIIKEGEICFTRKEENDEQPKEIGRLFRGNHFGEGALLTDQARRATAIAIGKVVLLSLRRDDFHKIFDQCLDKLQMDFAKRRDLDSGNNALMEFKDLQKIQVLGAGTYGQVLLVTHKVTGKTFALKCLSKASIKKRGQEQHIKTEKQLLESLDHPFIVNLVQTFSGNNYVYALLEAVLGGEIFTYLQLVRRLSIEDANFYIAQVIMVFEYLHSRNIIYRDLKPENIMIAENGYLKLTDFGLAKNLGTETKTYTLCGTPAYASPEVYNLSGHGKGVDWWTLGVLMHEMLAGTTPFNGSAVEIANTLELYKRAYPNIQLPRLLHNDAGDLVLRLLHPNPDRRIGCLARGPMDVKNHVLLKDFPWSKLMHQEMEAPYIPKISSMYDTTNFYEPQLDRPVELEENPLDVIAGAPWDL